MQVGFCLPAVAPVLASNFNLTPVVIGVIAVGVPFVWYLPKYGARHWYHGKAHLMPDTSIVSPFIICIALCCWADPQSVRSDLIVPKLKQCSTPTS